MRQIAEQDVFVYFISKNEIKNVNTSSHSAIIEA